VLVLVVVLVLGSRARRSALVLSALGRVGAGARGLDACAATRPGVTDGEERRNEDEWDSNRSAASCYRSRVRPPAHEYEIGDRHESVRIELDRSMKLVVISDTHSRPHPDAERWVAREEPARILHGGDVGARSVLARFEPIAPVLAVRGNIDPHELPDSIDVAFVKGESVVFRLLLVHIAVSGVKIRADAAELARRHDASLVVCGHSHVPLSARDKGLTVFNPGSIGPRRFALPIVFGVIEISLERGVSMRHVDCETGESWTPRGPR
jgi:putative phosphoesterase